MKAESNTDKKQDMKKQTSVETDKNMSESLSSDTSQKQKKGKKGKTKKQEEDIDAILAELESKPSDKQPGKKGKKGKKMEEAENSVEQEVEESGGLSLEGKDPSSMTQDEIAAAMEAQFEDDEDDRKKRKKKKGKQAEDAEEDEKAEKDEEEDDEEGGTVKTAAQKKKEKKERQKQKKLEVSVFVFLVGSSLHNSSEINVDVIYCKVLRKSVIWTHICTIGPAFIILTTKAYLSIMP